MAGGPARPAALLAAVAAEGLPFASGAFSRALQSLVEGGHLTPLSGGAVTLTVLGASERLVERDRWNAVLPTIARLLGEVEARPLEIVPEAPMPRPAAVADAYLDRVLIASVRERVAAAREGGPAFAVVLAQLDVDGVGEATRRAIVHRAIRATLGATATLLGGDVTAYRYGESGIAAIAPAGRDSLRGQRLATVVRTRLDELLRTMTTSVRAFAGARWQVRAGTATWCEELATSRLLLRHAESDLAADGPTRSAA